jgi:hypothetical protein
LHDELNRGLDLRRRRLTPDDEGQFPVRLNHLPLLAGRWPIRFPPPRLARRDASLFLHGDVPRQKVFVELREAIEDQSRHIPALLNLEQPGPDPGADKMPRRTLPIRRRLD